jgi:hypothetical protein
MFNRKCRSLESIVSNVGVVLGGRWSLLIALKGWGIMPFLTRSWKSHSGIELVHSIWRVWGQRWKHTRCALSLPCPEDPAVGLLERDKLCFDVTLDVGAVGFAEALDGASVLAVA